MRNNWRHFWLVSLSLILMIGLFLNVLPVQAQPGGFLKDFTFGFYGNNQEQQRQNREDVIARQGYCPTGGCILSLDKVEVTPNRAKPGDTLVLKTTYTILTPEQVALPVSITRNIYYHDKSLGRTKSVDMRRENGTWTQNIDFTLPANAAPGTYTLITSINTPYGTAQNTTKFQVD
jgi:hypothetical protein